ncbi:MAG: hypothetical protein SWI22_08895 [Pseudomonadota bacterium]|nr:hypothetical protein [Pseudomonadota bacterium]
MKPVVAYRHKLSWRIWRAWFLAKQAVTQAAPLVLAGLCMVLILASGFILSLREEVRLGHIVATGEFTEGGEVTAVVLVRLSDSGKVVRVESPTLAGCLEGDLLIVRETRSVGRRGQGYSRLWSRPEGTCSRPLP